MAENTRLPRRQSDGALHRLDPLEVFSTLRDEMDRFWRDPLRIGPLALPFASVTTSAAGFMPRVDVYERDNTIVVTAELPPNEGRRPGGTGRRRSRDSWPENGL
jgi:hypothetical protein